MTDVFSKQKRTKIMASIRSKGNKATELEVISIFKKRRIVGWRRNYKLYGKPDFVFPKTKIVVFVDGCFWHGCAKCNKKPSSNIIFWNDKITKNKKRDKIVNRQLKKDGWSVIRIWQHEINKERYIRKILQTLRGK